MKFNYRLANSHYPSPWNRAYLLPVTMGFGTSSSRPVRCKEAMGMRDATVPLWPLCPTVPPVTQWHSDALAQDLLEQAQDPPRPGSKLTHT